MKARTPCIFSPFRQKKTSEEDADEETVSDDITPHARGRTPDVQFDVVGLGRQKRKRLNQDTTSTSKYLSIDNFSANLWAYNCSYCT